MSSSEARANDVAVIGMSGRFPGASDVATYWDNICAGRETISRFSDAEVREAGIDPAALHHPGYVQAGGVLDGVEAFDADFFGFNARDAEITDPQQRVFLECAWEALEDAAYDPARTKVPIGVFAGMSMSRYVFNLYSRPDLMGTVGPLQVLLGTDKDHLTTRTAYKLDLSGPAITVQTACSTSLVAIALAYQSLLDFQCDMALAGGATIVVPQKAGYLYQVGGISSPDGHCRAFDAKAMGTVGGNGVGVVLLKRLEDALADGDAIHAVIRGAAINNDGSVKVGYTAPSVEGQAKVIALAQAVAEVEPDTIGLVEAHGTGTPLGDPIEVAALTRVFRAATRRVAYCALGSVKTNIGHLDCAAGVAGFIKAVLAVEHAVLPPSLHFEQPNPKLELDRSPFYVNTAQRPWKTSNGARRAAVSSFGIGGTNAHVIIEQAPRPTEGPTEGATERAAERAPSRRYSILPMSARSETALDSTLRRMSAFLARRPESSLPDVAYTWAVGRRAFSHRCALVTRTAETALAALQAPDAPSARCARRVARGACKTVFLFPGQGTQYVGMGRHLFEREPVFRDTFEHCARLLEPHLSLDITTVVYPHSADTAHESSAPPLDQTAYAQPALFVVEYALARLLEAWGIRPHALAGHSIGEYAAACLAGVFSLEDALAVVAARGRLMQSCAPGAMLAVALPEAEIGRCLSADVDLASVNGPRECVVSGPRSAIGTLEMELAAAGVPARLLATSHAFHSSMMEAAATQLETVIRGVRASAPAVPFLSNVTGDWITPDAAMSAEYWAEQLRRTVRFGDGLDKLVAVPEWALLEVGPGAVLTALAQRHAGRRPEQVAIPTMRRARDERDDDEALLEAVAELWTSGADIDWPRFYAGERRRRVHLPTYPFERRRYWIDARPAAAGEPGRSSAPARSDDVGRWLYRPVWRETDRPAATGGRGEAGRHWLVLSDAELGPCLASRLRAAGSTVTTAAAEGVHGPEQGDIRISPRSTDDYLRVLDALERDGRSPDVIVHAWGMSALAEPELGFDSLLSLARALSRRPARPLQLLVVSSGLHSVVASDTIAPEKATALGPVLVIPQEMPHVRCRSIDVPAAEAVLDLVPIAEMLIAEARDARADALVAYRGGRRLIRAIEPVAPQAAPRERVLLRERGVYLVTGGLGGMGLVLAEHLVRQAHARVTLVARTPLPERAEWDDWCKHHAGADRVTRAIERIKAMEALGGEVLVARANVADHDRMAAVVRETRERFGPVNGVIHAAGTAGGGIIQLKTPDMANRVLAPKVDGTLVLERVLRDETLDFFVLCSSLAAVLGGFGQVDYCAANAFLDAYAHAAPRRLKVARAVAIDWDTWRETGMAVDTVVPRELMAVREHNLAQGIGNEEGALLLMRALAMEDAQVLVSTRDWEARLAGMAAPAPTVGRAALAVGTAPLAVKHERPSSLPVPYVAARNDAEAFIAKIWEEMIGVSPIGVDDDFFALGGHSLLAIQIVTRLRDHFHVDVPVQLLFDAPTVAQLASRIRGTEHAGGADAARLAELVQYVGQLSDDDVRRLLSEQSRGRSS